MSQAFSKMLYCRSRYPKDAAVISYRMFVDGQFARSRSRFGSIGDWLG